MRITVKLDDLLYARRMTLTELAEKVDITLANLSILKTGKAKAIRFSTSGDDLRRARLPARRCADGREGLAGFARPPKPARTNQKDQP